MAYRLPFRGSPFAMNLIPSHIMRLLRQEGLQACGRRILALPDLGILQQIALAASPKK